MMIIRNRQQQQQRRKSCNTIFFVVILASLMVTKRTCAFTSSSVGKETPITNQLFKKQQQSLAPLLSSSTSLKMSDIPRDNESDKVINNDKESTTKKEIIKYMKSWIGKKLPPKPEDQLVMIGDILALVVYSILDHLFCNSYEDVVLKVDPTLSGSIETVHNLDPLGEWSSHTLPVWMDTYTTYSNINFSPEKLLLMMGLRNVVYSPVIATGGMAAVVLTSCWLLSGYVNKAFLYKNTLDCTMTRNLKITLQTWAVCTVMIVSLAIGSDYLMGTLQSSHTSIGGLTKADTDYIFDSLTVVLLWRAVLSFMLGSNSSNDDNDKEDK